MPPRSPKRLSKTEKTEFEYTFSILLQDLVNSKEFKDMPVINEWLREVFNYNVPHGKKTRGLMTVTAFKAFAKKPISNEDLRLSFVLGWCIEILQASALLIDDMMDGSKTRRGKPCWYLRKDVGPGAINDGILLEQCMYSILKIYFQDKEYYLDLIQLFLDMTLKTSYGQSLDTHMGHLKLLKMYTMETYKSIVKYKTGYYSFVFPVFAAMTMAGAKKSKEVMTRAEKILLSVGFYFQVQDDFLDCFGSEFLTGKIGTDLQDSKCSWLIVKALERVDKDQEAYLLKNIGSGDPEKVRNLKKLYVDLGVPALYDDFETEQFSTISEEIEKLKDDGVETQGQEFLLDVLAKLYRRRA